MRDFFRSYFTVKGIMARNRNQINATAIEYGLIAAGIALAIFAVVSTFGPKKKTGMVTPPAIVMVHHQA
ncbi:MAG: Flp family type IVb pilin [Patescibacteria group bacterium]